MNPHEGATEGTAALRLAPDGSNSRDFSTAVEAFLAHLESMGRTPSTIRGWRRMLERARKGAPFAVVSDVTFERISEYLARCAIDGKWQGNTYNSYRAPLKSFTRWAFKCGLLPADPMADSDAHPASHGDGARAATTEEARQFIAACIDRQRDGRSKSNRALYFLAQFLAGCRIDEPRKWTWRNLHLFPTEIEPVPFIRWLPKMHKNKRKVTVALAPELIDHLRRHRLTVPNGPDDPVFPKVPPPWLWAATREKTEIDYEDARGRRFTSHSARKWLTTTLTGAGVQEKMADYLMRHAGRVEHRYYDPPLAEQAAALAVLPRLWPVEPPVPHGTDLGVSLGNGQRTPGESPDSAESDEKEIDTAASGRYLDPAMPVTQSNLSTSRGPFGLPVSLSRAESHPRSAECFSPSAFLPDGLSKRMSGSGLIALTDLIRAQAAQLNSLANLLAASGSTPDASDQSKQQ